MHDQPLPPGLYLITPLELTRFAGAVAWLGRGVRAPVTFHRRTLRVFEHFSIECSDWA